MENHQQALAEYFIIQGVRSIAHFVGAHCYSGGEHY